MLKGIDPLLTADLLAALAAMGHGDELALVDRNFPAASTAQRLVALPGADIQTALRAVLQVLPLDDFVREPICRMQVTSRPDEMTANHRAVAATAAAIEGRDVELRSLARDDFYGRARGAYVTVLTGEHEHFACYLLTKGVIRP